MLAPRALLLLLAGFLLAQVAGMRPPSARSPESMGAKRPAARRRLQADLSSETFQPAGGKGSWESGGSTGTILIHANLMKGGDIVGWSARNQGLQEYGSVLYKFRTKEHEQLLDECGIHACKQAFCGAQVTTPWSEVLLIGGHADDIQWFRSYSHANRSLWSTEMQSGRWYPGAATLPDGRVLVVGGVNDSGKAGYHVEDDPDFNNPSYCIYDPAAKSFGPDEWGMSGQLSAAFPINTYALVAVTPDGGIAVAAGNLLAKYRRSSPTTFEKEHDFAPRPHAPWSYPQTGVGLPLPMFPPYDTLHFLAAGGSASDYAGPDTPASDAAHVIELTAGAGAQWKAARMPIPRVMGDGVILCDGTIGLFNGAGRGIAGWSKEPVSYRFRDGTSWDCTDKCSKASDQVYEPTIYDPASGKFSMRGSLEEGARPRLYHSVAILLPDCRVLVGGSDTTNDHTAEIFSPPYLQRGPRPVLAAAPSFIRVGETIEAQFSSADPVDRAILIRTGAVTHSVAFDARALWLTILSNSDGQIKLETPGLPNVLVPGMYMLVLLSSQGVPSEAKTVSVLGR